MSRQGDRLEELERAAAEQAALRRIATLVAAGATDADLATAVSSEIGGLFGAQRANMLRFDGDTIRVVGTWSADGRDPQAPGVVVPFGGDTITARIVETATPVRLNSAADLRTDFARRRWAELGLQASIGAPITVDGAVWGVVTASRTAAGDPFPPEVEHRLGDFAALVAQAIVNAAARREATALVAEQSALREIATLVAAGRPEAQVFEAVTSAVGALFDATSVTLVRWEGVLDEVTIVASWGAPGTVPPAPGSRYHPGRVSATIGVLETGLACRAIETSPERGTQSVIAAPLIVTAWLLGALTAARPADEPFGAGAEVRLRSFADLAAQSTANERAQAELRESRARIVRTADETRRKLERNLHDGAQQRLVAVSVALRLAAAKLSASPEDAGTLLARASDELAEALEELRDLARGLHPSVLTEVGFGAALDSLAERAPVPVTVENAIECRLTEPVAAALYYLVAESLTNVSRHAAASSVTVHARCDGDTAEIEVVDDGVGGADASAGSGIRGLADRVEALAGRFGVESPSGGGTRVWASIPLEDGGGQSSG